MSSHSPAVGLKIRDFGFDFKIDHTVINKRRTLATFPVLPPDPRRVDLGPIFNQFLIIGAPRQKKFHSKPSPITLLVYPASPLILDPSEFPRVRSFCFPNGFDEINHISKDIVLDQFVFTISTSRSDSIPVYGVCTHFSFASARDVFFASGASKLYPVCFCYLTKNPVIAPIFHYLMSLGKWIAGIGLPIVSRNHTAEQSREEPVEVLPGMVVVGQVQRHEGFLIPRVLLSELSYIRSVKVDEFEEKIIAVTKKEQMVIPTWSIASKSICYVGMDLVFSKLSVQTIVRIVSILLLEKPCVMISSSLYVVSICMLCMHDLCKPFKGGCTFLAILPDHPDYEGLLDAPVPYVCGLVRRREMPAIPPHVVVVDIDRDAVNDPEKSPVMPQSRPLAVTIEQLIARNRADIEMPAAKASAKVRRPHSALAAEHRTAQGHEKAPKEMIDFVKKKVHRLIVPSQYLRYMRKYIFGPSVVGEIVDLFRRHLSPTLDQLIRPCFITDTTDIAHPVTVFNRELFLASVSGQDRPFYEVFIGTTGFQLFSDSKMDETAERLSKSGFSRSSPCLKGLAKAGFNPDDLGEGMESETPPQEGT